jgi:glutamyl-tRNA reductase
MGLMTEHEQAGRNIAECMSSKSGLDELVILGVTHKSADSMDQLSSLVIPESLQEERLNELREVLDAEELVYISTCNRASFIIISRRGPAVLLKVLRAWFIANDPHQDVPPEEQWVQLQGRNALDHLLLVASSLDSMVVGERQILGQFKQSFIRAKALGISGPKIHFLYEQVLTVVKRVYTNTSLSEGKLSVVSLAESKITEFCEKHKHVTAVLVGAGKMIEQSGTFLAKTPHVKLVFVNRTKERSDEFVERFGGSSMSLEAFFAERPHFDVLATATSAPHYLFGTSFFSDHRQGHHDKLVIDLAIPPDVDPAAGEMEGITLINMDSLRKQAQKHQNSRGQSVSEAQAILAAGAQTIIDRWKVRNINPAIGAIRERYEREGIELLNKLLAKELPHLDFDEKEALNAWVRVLAKRWAVVHADGIKQVARKCCMKAVSSYLDGVGVERARQ